MEGAGDINVKFEKFNYKLLNHINSSLPLKNTLKGGMTDKENIGPEIPAITSGDPSHYFRKMDYSNLTLTKLANVNFFCL